MFRANDRHSLCISQGRTIDGNLIPFFLKLPLETEDYPIPDDLVGVNIFDFHEGGSCYGYVAFHILVGEKTTFDDLIVGEKNKTIHVIDELNIPSIDSTVCCQTVGDTKKIFAILNDQDIVVENHEQLREVIGIISNEYESFCNSANKIKTLAKTFKNTKK